MAGTWTASLAQAIACPVAPPAAQAGVGWFYSSQRELSRQPRTFNLELQDLASVSWRSPSAPSTVLRCLSSLCLTFGLLSADTHSIRQMP